jgi:hypothetical protein
MVALTKGANPLGRGQGSDDQQQAAKAAKMVAVEGQMLHPDVLERLKWDKNQFSDWLADAKAQLDRSQLCISALTARIQQACEALPSGRKDVVLEAFSNLKEQLDRAPSDIHRALDDFCRFSSGYHYRRAVDAEVDGTSAVAASQADSGQAGAVQEVVTRASSLRGAIARTIPYIERMNQFYREDQQVYQSADTSRLQAQDGEYLDRGTALFGGLTRLVVALTEFASLAGNSHDSVSSF